MGSQIDSKQLLGILALVKAGENEQACETIEKLTKEAAAATSAPAAPTSAKALLSQLSINSDMGRRRLQRKGYLIKKSGSWLGRWREYALDGSSVQRSRVIAPAVGPEAVNRSAADRLFWNEVLSKLDQRVTKPGSMMTVGQFAKNIFQVQVVDRRKPSTQKHYRYILGNFVLPALGHKRLCDVGRIDVEALVSTILKNYSSQLAVHIKNAVSRLFRHAEALECYQGRNPAAGVDCGELVHERRPTLSWEQCRRALELLASPYREMAWLSIETSANVAELCGLRRIWVNCTAQPKEVEGHILSPFSIGIRENWYEGKRGSLKTGKRRRDCPISETMARDLQALIHGSGFEGEEYPLFCSAKGTPVDAHNASNRFLAPVARRLGFPVNWHAFRRAHSTFVGEIPGVSVEDRRLTMGHSDAAMSLYYSVEDIERRRKIPEQIRERLSEGGKPKLVRATG